MAIRRRARTRSYISARTMAYRAPRPRLASRFVSGARLGLKGARFASRWAKPAAQLAGAGIGLAFKANRYAKANLRSIPKIRSLDEATRLANQFKKDWTDIKHGYSSIKSKVQYFANIASGPDDSPIMSQTETSIPVSAQHSRGIRSGNRTGLPGRNFKSVIHLGGKINPKWKTLMKLQGVSKFTAYDTAVDSSSDVVVGISTRRKQLSTSHGFNQKTCYFLENHAYPRLVYPISEVLGAPGILTSQSATGNVKLFAGVVSSTATHTFSNLNNQLPVFLKVMVVIPQALTWTPAVIMPKVFGVIAGAQTQNAIPQRDLQQDITGVETNWFGGYARVNPKANVMHSAFWRRIMNIASSKTVKLEPNDVWTLTIKDVYKNGIDVHRAGAFLSDSGQANSVLREQYAINYMVYIEHWGPKVDAVEYVADDGDPTTRGIHIGPAPGSVSRESKVTWTFVRPKIEVDGVTGNISTFGAYEYISTRVQERTDKEFYRNFLNIGKPGEAGRTLYVPIESDTTTRYADTVLDDTSAGE